MCVQLTLNITNTNKKENRPILNYYDTMDMKKQATFYYPQVGN